MSMFVDSSTLVAMLTVEADAGSMVDKLEEAGFASTSPVSFFETVMAIARLKDTALSSAQRELEKFLAAANIEVSPITLAEASIAIEAYDSYGKGRHKASLNMGDCFSYACAKAHRVPLLFKGDGFIHTDITPA